MNKPPRKIVVEEEGSGARLGFVAIDSTIEGRAQGGLRMGPDVSLDELEKLARAMTLKFGFLGLPQGGAKAGVLGDPESGAEARSAVLHRFAKAIRPLLERREYTPYSDLGTSAAEIQRMLEGVGLTVPGREYRGSLSGEYTAGTVFEAARAAAAVQGLNLSGLRVAIEGFGEVGQPLAGMFVRAGARVVAISTSRGGLYHPLGLDIAKLRALARQMGSAAVKKYDACDRIESSCLKELPADIFCPCARHDSVQTSDVAGMPARVLSCGANCPLTPEAERLLWRRGAVCVPDFVANSGGVLGGTMQFCGWRREEILLFLERRFRPAVERLIRSALEAGRPLRDMAEDVALRRFDEVKRRAELPSAGWRCFSAGVALYRAGWVPARLVRPLSIGYFNDRVSNRFLRA
jgi:glutamate dehydrogenase (NAD(P)+)